MPPVHGAGRRGLFARRVVSSRSGRDRRFMDPGGLYSVTVSSQGGSLRHVGTCRFWEPPGCLMYAQRSAICRRVLCAANCCPGCPCVMPGRAWITWLWRIGQRFRTTSTTMADGGVEQLGGAIQRSKGDGHLISARSDSGIPLGRFDRSSPGPDISPTRVRGDRRYFHNRPCRFGNSTELGCPGDHIGYFLRKWRINANIFKGR